MIRQGSVARAREPIASVLLNDVELPAGLRIWWCPTSKFTTLPLHAAGLRAEELYGSPYYVPSLSGLIHTRERVRAQRQARGATGTLNAISFAAVCQARPSTNIELVEVEHEIQRICNETDVPADVMVVTREAATIQGTIQAFETTVGSTLSVMGRSMPPSRPNAGM